MQSWAEVSELQLRVQALTFFIDPGLSVNLLDRHLTVVCH